jgi:anti-anti-sigma factor
MKNDFRISLEGTTLKICLGNELTAQNAPLLQEALMRYQGQAITKMVYDATHLVYISSIGLRVITYAYQRLGHSPKIEFVNCDQKMYEIFDIIGFTNIITFVEDKSRKEQTGVTDIKLQKKLNKLHEQKIDYFAANNDVVMYQMKLGQEDDE